MTDDISDGGFTINALWGAAWVLGLITMGSLVILIKSAVDDVPVQSQVFLWLGVGVIASVFSACCAVLAGVKAAEQRLALRMGTPRS